MIFRIPRIFAKVLLRFTSIFHDKTTVMVCRGYNDDEDYTGLYWNEDKDLDFKDSNYSDFQIWINNK